MQSNSSKVNPVKEKSFSFAVEIVRLCQELKQRREYVLSNQLLRAGTSVGANIEEALAGQSRRDFLSKMAIASKEARETRYWLNILIHSSILEADLKPYLESVDELIRLLTAIVKSTKNSTSIQNSKLRIEN